MTGSTLGERAVLVRVHINTWGGRKQDKGAARDLEAGAGAERGATRVTKYLVPREATASIMAVSKGIKREVERLSSPWGVDGDRILPSEHLVPFFEATDRAKTRFNAAVDNYMREYVEGRRAQQRRLGALFDEDDYPPPEVVADRFSLSVEINPIPEADDFRVDLSEEQRLRLAEAVEQEVTERMQKAMRDVFWRLNSAVETFHGQLSDESAILRRKTYDHLGRLIEAMPALNLSDDPVLQKAVKELRATITSVDMKELQDNAKLRDKARKKSERVMTTLLKKIAE